MTKPQPEPYVMDDEYRRTLTGIVEQFAKQMLDRQIWRTSWRVEVDGCVYKFKVEGYPKYGTQRWRDRQKAMEIAQQEFAAEHGNE